MGDEDIRTIPEKESNEFIKSCVEDLVPISRESEDTSDSDKECDFPFCDHSMTFSNPMFDLNDDFTFSDDKSLSDEDVSKDNVKIYSNLFFKFDDEYISITPLSDANEDECFDPGGDVDKINAFDIHLDFEDCYYDSNGDVLYLESLLSDDTTPISLPRILENFFSPTYVSFLFKDRHYLFLTYVIRIFLIYSTYPVDSSFLLSSGSEDTIFDPGIFAFHFSSLELVVYHRSGTFMCFNVYLKILNESPMEICSFTRFNPNITMIWVQDYALWDVIENGNSFNPVPRTTANADGTSTLTIPGPVAYLHPKLLICPGLEEFQHPEFKGYGPKAILTKSGIVPITTARQSSSRAAAPVSAARPINTVAPKPLVNVAKPRQNALHKSHSLSRRPFYQQSALKNRNLNNKINTAKVNSVNTAKGNKVTSAVGKQRINVVKSSACWGDPQDALKDQGYFHSGCSRHMTGNISYLTDFKEHDGGYVAFGGGAKCGKITGKGTIRTVPRKNNMYSFDMKNIVPQKDLTCLLAKATNDESMLWHRRLGHINFKNINKLVKENLVRDLFGPTYVSSIMHKKYRLVITDNFSRFTWVFFLATKNETSRILKIFITKIENLVDKKVKIIRCDNEPEFKNSVMNEFCEEKGIKREYSVARTPQQNEVAERRNRTLIEAARTMLADSKLPTIFWAEAVNNPLGKFDGKSEGIFVGYSTISKAFRVYNTRTRKVEENMHITFLENKPMITDGGPKWLFDIDALSESMNYE
uniref:Integrase catalytic domain-containing protein n=1 Tax=Tanacetum cinerariifolium TaxID=118510 RepID=A0A6L2LY15_TANCI|nr:hypothetical protein [Tanacetum cinerariifolium]